MKPSLDTGSHPAQPNHVERDPTLQSDKPPLADGPHRLDARTWLVERFSWTWFTATQSTGGMAIVLAECPHQFNGLHTIGAIIFIFNIVLWLLFTVLTITRWRLKPTTLYASFTQPPEAYFYGSWWLTAATIILGIQHYGVPHSGPWLIDAIRVLFWIYAACTLLSSLVVFVVMTKHSPIKNPGGNPSILLTVFHAMLTGTVAAGIVREQPEAHRLPIMVAGVGFQGYGWILSMIYVGWIFSSLLQNGFPGTSSVRPGFFMLVGTAGYTIVVLIGNARGAPSNYGYFASHPMAAEIVLVMATWTSIFLWVFTFWCFAMVTISILSDMIRRDEKGRWRLTMSWHNTWWAFIFPNVGFTISTIYLGQELESEAIMWVSTGMVILLVVFWLFDMVLFFKTVGYSMLRDSRVKLS
jgi:tellurite resistance protein TehA-like permease